MVCCVFFRAAFCRSVSAILPYASFHCSAKVGYLIPLVHSFHFQSVVTTQSLCPGTHCCTHGTSDGPTELANDRRNRPDHPSRDTGVVVQVRQKLLAIGVRLAQETLAVHEPLLDTAREP